MEKPISFDDCLYQGKGANGQQKPNRPPGPAGPVYAPRALCHSFPLAECLVSEAPESQKALSLPEQVRDHAPYFGAGLLDCYLVKSSADYGNTRTYYSDKIRVNPESFKEHQVGNWYKKLKSSNGAITLKTITQHKGYIEIQEAIKITERKVDRKEFDLPKKPVAASFTALDQKVKMKEPSQDAIACYRENILKAPVLYGRTKKVTSLISFVVTAEGLIKFPKPYEKDEHNLYKIATDILNNCGLQFMPGLIDGKPVDSEVYFPVEFNL